MGGSTRCFTSTFGTTILAEELELHIAAHRDKLFVCRLHGREHAKAHVFVMAVSYPTIAQCAVVATALKVLLFPT